MLKVATTSILLLVLLQPHAFAASSTPREGYRGMVVTSQSNAARAGRSILAQGGNAIDAAVATAFALSVTQPFSSGLGGGAFLLIRTAAGETIAIDARETAPAKAHRDMYIEEGVPEDASTVGPLAVATPGLLRGLALALESYGTMPLATVMQPAIELAANGFEIGPYHAKKIEWMREHLSAADFPETVRIQFNNGAPVKIGWRLVQKDLAKTLRTIAKQGPDVFYTGAIATAIANHVQGKGGILTLADLAGYKPVLREAVSGSYRGVEIHSYPPPSSGGVVLLEILNILEGYDLAALGSGSSASIHLIGESMKLAFADRAAYMGDSDFIDVPVEALISKEYGDKQRARINPPWFKRSPDTWFNGKSVLNAEGPGLPQNDSGTAHLSVVDAAGNAVAITKTINTLFGSGITVPGTGVILNNEMDDFAVAPDTPNAYGLVDTTGANAIEPFKRPLSSMSPTILVKNGKPFMITGSPGGPRIITTTLLTILNIIDYDMNVQEAVAAPRFHHQWIPDKLYLEPEFSADVIEALEARGHNVTQTDRRWSSAQAIVIDPATGRMTGGSDPRADGQAVPY
ncbi:MAG: gamma-glutamyltransferase [Myxococcales bacterium]|nr:gamma-glutamyltransferase [Myxococcales bacterium]